MKRAKVIYWLLLSVAYVHVSLKYHLVSSFDSFGMLYAFGILPLGYALSLVLFEKRKVDR